MACTHTPALCPCGQGATEEDLHGSRTCSGHVKPCVSMLRSVAPHRRPGTLTGSRLRTERQAHERLSVQRAHGASANG